MITVAVQPRFVKKGKAVYLSKALPTGFLNKKPIPAKAKGEVISQGFEAGMLKVLFRLHSGDEQTQFNELSAKNYLECDPYL